MAVTSFVLGVEALAFAAWWVRTGEPFTWDAVELRAAEVAGDLAPLRRIASGGPATPDRPAIALHPYLGYTMDPGSNAPHRVRDLGRAIDGLGFLGAEPFLGPREPAELRVGIVGGSVAGMLGVLGDDALTEGLSEIPGLAGRRVRIVDLAVGGYKQPQQVLAVAWFLSLGGELDVVVNVDGLNEVMLPTSVDGGREMSPFYPWSWSMLAGEAQTQESMAAMARVVGLRTSRARAAASLLDSPLRHSPTAALVWSVLDARRAAELGEADAALTAIPTGVPAELRGPRPDTEPLVEACIGMWARSSRLLADLCDARGMQYFHFLQPNQYVTGSKLLSDEERRIAIHPESRLPALLAEAYPLARRAGCELAADGVRFHDLTMVFEKVEETLYRDTCCHLNELGNRLLAREIARVMAADPCWGEPPADLALTGLVVEPPSLRFEAPLQRRSLRVLGTVEGGGRIDLTAHGVTFTASADDALRVGRFGDVEALAAGDHAVEVRFGAHRLSVPVSVEFMPVVDLGGGAAAGRPGGPSLSIDPSSEEGLVIRLLGLEELESVALFISPRAERRPTCGGTGYVDPFDSEPVPLVAREGTCEIVLPRPPAGSASLYLQVFAVDDRHRCGWALSNAVVVTAP